MDLRREIEQFKPFNEQEERDRLQILRWMDTGLNLYTRENGMAHFTASAWVVSGDRTKVLMAFHKIYQSWAWLGGHADGERDLLQTALREVKEESGVTHVSPLQSAIFSLEILTVDGHWKNGEYVSSHLHLNVTYLLTANERDPLYSKPDENSNVAWFLREEALQVVREPWMNTHIYQKLNAKLECL